MLVAELGMVQRSPFCLCLGRGRCGYAQAGSLFESLVPLSMVLRIDEVMNRLWLEKYSNA